MVVQITPSRLTLDGGGSSVNTSLTYDPKTGSWVPATPLKDKNEPPAPVPWDSDSSSPNNSGNTNSKKEAEKEYIEAEFNVLTGEMTLTPTNKSIRIKVKDTIKVEGLGKYLSGLYFVSAVSRTLNADNGYSHSFTLLKNGFSDSVKKAQETSTSRKEEVSKQASELKVGDSVKIVGDNAVYSNAHDGVKVPNWVKKKTLTVQKVSDDGTRVLVQPINSWTYIKYVQKV